MMIATSQPYFLPWPGFFYKALQADALVLLDDVQFPLGRGWMARNRIKSDQGELWLRVPVWRKGRGLQLIREVDICEDYDWRTEHLRGISQQYAHAPYWERYRSGLSAVYERRHRRLVEFNVDLIHYLWEGLGLPGRPVLQSQLGVAGRGTALLASLCRALRADSYLTLVPAQKHLDGAVFSSEAVRLVLARYRPVVYPQLWGPNRYNLSALDLLLNCGPKGREIIERAG